jgi:hypothetical protein
VRTAIKTGLTSSQPPSCPTASSGSA